MQVPQTDTCVADDRELLLRGWIDANICHVDHNADRVHATKIVIRSRLEQFLPKHPLLYWCHCWGSNHLGDRQRLAIYYSGNLDTVERGGHLGNEAIWASVARENGSGAGLTGI